jgi:uncharacterized protein (TIGR00299 family) protein
MGAAGDMLMAALYELLSEEQKNDYLQTMEELFAENVQLKPESEMKCGIRGTHMHVKIHGTEEGAHIHGDDHAHAHEHHSYTSLLEQIHAMPLPENVKNDAAAVYRLIGEAESAVHGQPLEQIHFHEVGSWDALADVVGCCLLFSMIRADSIVSSPIHVGNGTVRCAHGILPVPAPATAELLKGIPFYTGDIQSELCTPTGAALLRHFASEFSPMPAMVTKKTGIGLGTKDFESANCLRVFYGETDISMQTGETDTICDLSCNLDDMTGEELGYCMEVLFEAGALDVFYQPIQMKKNRPGILLHCFCRPEKKDTFLGLLFTHTTTRGIRIQMISRAVLSSRFEEVQTPCGTIRSKVSTGYGITKSKYEFEDVKKAARENNLSLADVKKQI